MTLITLLGLVIERIPDCTTLQEYFTLDRFDLFGMNGEKLLEKLSNEYSQGNPLKKIQFDWITLPDQAKYTAKTFKDNELPYTATGLGWGMLKLGKGLSLAKSLIHFVK
jgi:hypothetical protein